MIGQLVSSIERAGDEANQLHLYADAAQWYQKALTYEELVQSDQLRIAAKLKNAYFLSSDPSAATPVAAWLTRSYRVFEQGSSVLVEALVDAARQMHVDAKSEQSLSLVEEAVRVAKGANLTALERHANVWRVAYLHRLDRNIEASQLLLTIRQPENTDPPSLRRIYYAEKGQAESYIGNAEQTHANYKLAISAAEEDTDPHVASLEWSNYVQALWRLGEVEQAKLCCERAIVVARKHQIPWQLSGSYIRLAGLSFTMGQDEEAREHLAQAIAYKFHMPFMEILTYFFGVPIALKLNDLELLVHCEQLPAPKLAAQSGNPTLTGSVMRAAALLEVSRGKMFKARALLHKALPHLRRMDLGWDLLLSIGEFGSEADLPAARALFEHNMGSRGTLADACLFLFDAFAARRNGDTMAMQTSAAEAARLFKQLQWHAYADTAVALAAIANPERSHSTPRNAAALYEKLTARERQVFALILEGLTNKDIAVRLSISKHTTDTHVSSILSRLGVRSRHELLYLFGRR